MRSTVFSRLSLSLLLLIVALVAINTVTAATPTITINPLHPSRLYGGGYHMFRFEFDNFSSTGSEFNQVLLTIPQDSHLSFTGHDAGDYLPVELFQAIGSSLMSQCVFPNGMGNFIGTILATTTSITFSMDSHHMPSTLPLIVDCPLFLNMQQITTQDNTYLIYTWGNEQIQVPLNLPDSLPTPTISITSVEVQSDVTESADGQTLSTKSIIENLVFTFTTNVQTGIVLSGSPVLPIQIPTSIILPYAYCTTGSGKDQKKIARIMAPARYHPLRNLIIELIEPTDQPITCTLHTAPVELGYHGGSPSISLSYGMNLASGTTKEYTVTSKANYASYSIDIHRGGVDASIITMDIQFGDADSYITLDSVLSFTFSDIDMQHVQLAEGGESVSVDTLVSNSNAYCMVLEDTQALTHITTTINGSTVNFSDFIVRERYLNEKIDTLRCVFYISINAANDMNSDSKVYGHGSLTAKINNNPIYTQRGSETFPFYLGPHLLLSTPSNDLKREEIDNDKTSTLLTLEFQVSGGKPPYRFHQPRVHIQVGHKFPIRPTDLQCKVLLPSDSSSSSTYQEITITSIHANGIVFDLPFDSTTRVIDHNIQCTINFPNGLFDDYVTQVLFVHLYDLLPGNTVQSVYRTERFAIPDHPNPPPPDEDSDDSNTPPKVEYYTASFFVNTDGYPTKEVHTEFVKEFMAAFNSLNTGYPQLTTSNTRHSPPYSMNNIFELSSLYTPYDVPDAEFYHTVTTPTYPLGLMFKYDYQYADKLTDYTDILQKVVNIMLTKLPKYNIYLTRMNQGYIAESVEDLSKFKCGMHDRSYCLAGDPCTVSYDCYFTNNFCSDGVCKYLPDGDLPTYSTLDWLYNSPFGTGDPSSSTIPSLMVALILSSLLMMMMLF